MFTVTKWWQYKPNPNTEDYHSIQLKHRRTLIKFCVASVLKNELQKIIMYRKTAKKRNVRDTYPNFLKDLKVTCLISSKGKFESDRTWVINNAFVITPDGHWEIQGGPLCSDEDVWGDEETLLCHTGNLWVIISISLLYSSGDGWFPALYGLEGPLQLFVILSLHLILWSTYSTLKKERNKVP